MIEWERLEISKKIRDNKGTFYAKMSIVKDRNNKDLTEAEDIKKGEGNGNPLQYSRRRY